MQLMKEPRWMAVNLSWGRGQDLFSILVYVHLSWEQENAKRNEEELLIDVLFSRNEPFTL